MGQRANLIVVEHKQYTLYYDHWAANSLDSYLFWGPEPVVTYIRGHEKSGEEWWLDTIWCEGGAVVDLDNKVLLFFGGEDFLYGIPLRQMYFQLLPYLWPGYKLRWACRGIADLAAYVGYHTGRVTDQDIQVPAPAVWERAFAGSWEEDLEGVLSICENNRLSLHPLYGFIDADKLLLAGPELIQIASQYKSRTTFCYPDLSTETYIEFAKLGIHLDVGRREVFYWTAAPDTAPPSLLQTFWKDWNINYLRDDYHAHEILTQNKLSFTQPKEQLIQEQVRSIVCRPYGRDDAFAIDIFTKLTAAGNKVEINPAIYATNLFDMPAKLREAIFDKVVRHWKKEREHDSPVE